MWTIIHILYGSISLSKIFHVSCLHISLKVPMLSPSPWVEFDPPSSMSPTCPFLSKHERPLHLSKINAFVQNMLVPFLAVQYWTKPCNMIVMCNYLKTLQMPLPMLWNTFVTLCAVLQGVSSPVTEQCYACPPRNKSFWAQWEALPGKALK